MTRKNIMKRIISIAMALVLCLTLAGLVDTSKAQAATTVSAVPITCQVLGNSNVTTYVAINGKVSGYIAPKDVCKIKKIYNSGWVQVQYPTSKGQKTAYAKSSAFFVNVNFSTSTKTTASNTTVYYKSNLSSKLGTTTTGDKVYVVGSKSGNQQILYPISGGYKMGFVKGNLNTKSTKTTTTTPKTTNLSYGLYKNSKASITCGFDGYTTTSGRHEGIDIKCSLGASVYALASGTVVRVAKGSTGSSGLSTIAIYNSDTNKTIIYLHSAPVNLKVGQTINKGDKIATESWRGISSSNGSHTHVEVRNGKQGYASKSVGDPVLNNSNPTSFWNQLGYAVK